MKTIMMTVAALTIATTAIAADLPKKDSAPLLPAITQTDAYLGGTFGGRFDDEINYEQYTLGIVVGSDVNSFLGAEVTYDYFAKDNGNQDGHVLFANGVVRLENDTNVTPYVLAGLGHGWGRFDDENLYNIGVGVRSKITEDVDLDVRYRRINDFDNNSPTDAVTAGVIFKF